MGLRGASMSAGSIPSWDRRRESSCGAVLRHPPLRHPPLVHQHSSLKLAGHRDRSKMYLDRITQKQDKTSPRCRNTNATITKGSASASHRVTGSLSVSLAVRLAITAAAAEAAPAEAAPAGVTPSTAPARAPTAAAAAAAAARAALPSRITCALACIRAVTVRRLALADCESLKGLVNRTRPSRAGRVARKAPHMMAVRGRPQGTRPTTNVKPRVRPGAGEKREKRKGRTETATARNRAR